MSNLGGYQTIVGAVKSLGGPKKATAIVGSAVALGGYGILRVVEAGVKRAVTASKSTTGQRDMPCPTMGQIFKVSLDGEDSSGLKFTAGETYRVLECDADAICIEVFGATGNPHVVSDAFLASISNFPPER